MGTLADSFTGEPEHAPAEPAITAVAIEVDDDTIVVVDKERREARIVDTPLADLKERHRALTAERDALDLRRNEAALLDWARMMWEMSYEGQRVRELDEQLARLEKEITALETYAARKRG